MSRWGDFARFGAIHASRHQVREWPKHVGVGHTTPSRKRRFMARMAPDLLTGPLALRPRFAPPFEALRLPRCRGTRPRSRSYCPEAFWRDGRAAASHFTHECLISVDIAVSRSARPIDSAVSAIRRMCSFEISSFQLHCPLLPASALMEPISLWRCDMFS